MTEATRPTDLRAMAAYPDTVEDATAARLARAIAVSAQTRWQRQWKRMEQREKGEIDRQAWMDSAAAMVAEFGIVALLRRLIDVDPVMADVAAAQLWNDWEDGGSIGEWLWEWLNQTGVDPEEVNAMVAEADKTLPGGDSKVQYSVRQFRLAHAALVAGKADSAQGYIAGALITLTGQTPGGSNVVGVADVQMRDRDA